MTIGWVADAHMGEFTHSRSHAGSASDASLASLLCALSFASGLALGDRMEHGIGTAYIGLRLADAVHLAEDEREAVYYGALLKDAGCTACASLFGAVFPDDPRPRISEMLALDRTRLGDVWAGCPGASPPTHPCLPAPRGCWRWWLSAGPRSRRLRPAIAKSPSCSHADWGSPHTCRELSNSSMNGGTAGGLPSA
jgi:hypothetical protein